MSTQAPAKTKLTWDEKLDLFVAMYGPFALTTNDYRTFKEVEGFLEVYWPGLHGRPPLIERDEKPRCAACGSARPMSFRYLTDRSGLKHLVGEECYRRLHELKHVTLLDFVSPIPEPDSEDKAG